MENSSQGAIANMPNHSTKATGTGKKKRDLTAELIASGQSSAMTKPTTDIKREDNSKAYADIRIKIGGARKSPGKTFNNEMMKVGTGRPLDDDLDSGALGERHERGPQKALVLL